VFKKYFKNYLENKEHNQGSKFNKKFLWHVILKLVYLFKKNRHHKHILMTWILWMFIRVLHLPQCHAQITQVIQLMTSLIHVVLQTIVTLARPHLVVPLRSDLILWVHLFMGWWVLFLCFSNFILLNENRKKERILIFFLFIYFFLFSYLKIKMINVKYF